MEYRISKVQSMQEIGSMQYPAIASYRDAKAQSRLAFVIDGALYDAAAAKAAGVPILVVDGGMSAAWRGVRSFIAARGHS